MESAQLDLFNEPDWNHPLFSRFKSSVIDQFREFHSENPAVYDEFKRLARMMKNSGRKKYSVDAIIHVIRWNFALRTTGHPFKISNNIRAIYGRLLAFDDPQFATFFNFKNK
jgi:hypothetical protein